MAAINETVKRTNDLLKSRAIARGIPAPSPQPVIGTGKTKSYSESETALVWYKWCQDIIQESLSYQMQTRPEQVVKADDPNAKKEKQI